MASRFIFTEEAETQLLEILDYTRQRKRGSSGSRAGRDPMHQRLKTEIVDSEEKIEGFVPLVDEPVTEGLVTLEAVCILGYVSP